MRLRRKTSHSELVGETLMEPMLEQLERRQMLSGTTAFPALSDLQNPNNTVVRLSTNMGDIYIELYDVAGPNGASAAPITVSNFLSYVRRGDYDESFFHRLSFLDDPSNPNDPQYPIKPNASAPFVLQGGGFRWIDGTGISAIPTQPPIINEFDAARSNVERSVAMAKRGNDPNSATSQFFINLGDNGGVRPGFSGPLLDAQNGGFTVFGRVAGEASWQVVMDIVALMREDLRQEITGPHSNNFATVPVMTDLPNGTQPTEAQLVTIEDIEVVKPRDTTMFYTQLHYYAEGFAGSTINEFLPIANPSDQIVFYQVIARAEVPQGTAADGFTWFRDRVLQSGTIAPGARGGITISQFGEGGAPGQNDLVPQGVPYSLEVWATRPLAVNISHYDFGTSTGEAFTQELSLTWGFGQAEKAAGVADFLVWSNPNPEPATINITFYFENAAPTTVTVVTDRFRRGGLALAEMPQIPDNSVFSIVMSSDQEIVAALTHFDQRIAGDPVGSAALGVPGPGSKLGVLPLASSGPNISDTIAVVNPGNTTAVVNFVLTFSDPDQDDLELPVSLLIPPRSRDTFDFATVPQIADGRRYSVRFQSSADVYASWLHGQVFPGISNRDAVSMPLSDVAATAWRFAEGFIDPNRAGVDVFETISVFNPNFDAFTGAPDATANVTFTFRYHDGFAVTETRSVGPGERVDLDVQTLQSILAQGANQRFFFWIEVTSNIPVVAQMWHFDLTLGGLQPSGGFATLGTPTGTVVRLDALGDLS